MEGLLIGCERLSECVVFQLIGRERLSDCAEFRLIGCEWFAEHPAFQLIGCEKPPERSEGLSICVRMMVCALRVTIVKSLCGRRGTTAVLAPFYGSVPLILMAGLGVAFTSFNFVASFMRMVRVVSARRLRRTVW